MGASATKSSANALWKSANIAAPVTSGASREIHGKRIFSGSEGGTGAWNSRPG